MEGKYDYAPGDDENDDNRHGITFRSIKELFDQVNVRKASSGKYYRIYCSFLQIYNEKIYDLLNVSCLEGQGLRLRWNKEDQFKVENLFVFEVENYNEAIEIYNYGIKNRIVAAHNLNLFSSRSHCLFTLNVEAIDAENMEQMVISKLQLVDLAGSERTMQTGNYVNERHFKESIDINKSLFILRKVISILSEDSSVSSGKSKEHKFIPYRDSKLTSLLKQSLGGSSYCLMVIRHYFIIKTKVDCMCSTIRCVC
jgi:kinesin family protein 4/21/27